MNQYRKSSDFPSKPVQSATPHPPVQSKLPLVRLGLRSGPTRHQLAPPVRLLLSGPPAPQVLMVCAVIMATLIITPNPVSMLCVGLFQVLCMNYCMPVGGARYCHRTCSDGEERRPGEVR